MQLIANVQIIVAWHKLVVVVMVFVFLVLFLLVILVVVILSGFEIQICLIKIVVVECLVVVAQLLLLILAAAEQIEGHKVVLVVDLQLLLILLVLLRKLLDALTSESVVLLMLVLLLLLLLILLYILIVKDNCFCVSFVGIAKIQFYWPIFLFLRGEIVLRVNTAKLGCLFVFSLLLLLALLVIHNHSLKGSILFWRIFFHLGEIFELLLREIRGFQVVVV